jgi:hypothetical protein
MYSEINKLLGIEKTTNTVEDVEIEYPFNQLDSDHVRIDHMLDGSTRVDRYPFRRYSTYLQNFNVAAQEFGYELDYFKESGLDGYWLFRNEDYRYPYITVSPGSCTDQFRLRVNIEYDDTVDIKTIDDCFDHINKCLSHIFKMRKYIPRNLKLINLLK